MTKGFLAKVVFEERTKEFNMKRFLLLISALSLFAYGCNREGASSRDAGLMQEETVERGTFDNTDVEVVEPAMQEDSDIQRMEESDPMLESDPVLEQDPGMQEEQIRFNESESIDSMDTVDERDSSMGSGTDTAPAGEPTDATGIRQ